MYVSVLPAAIVVDAPCPDVKVKVKTAPLCPSVGAGVVTVEGAFPVFLIVTLNVVETPTVILEEPNVTVVVPIPVAASPLKSAAEITSFATGAGLTITCPMFTANIFVVAKATAVRLIIISEDAIMMAFLLVKIMFVLFSPHYILLYSAYLHVLVLNFALPLNNYISGFS